MIDRRKAVALFGCSAIFWQAGALALHAQGQPRGGWRRIALLNVSQNSGAALVQRLGDLNWHEGNNLRIDWRRAGGDATLTEQSAVELLALEPDVIVVGGSLATAALLRRTSKTPIVFVAITDPAGQHFVDSLAHPGGNVTGFSDFDPPMAGKWLGMLTQITPPVSHVAVIFNPMTAPFADLMLRTLDEAATSLAVVVRAARCPDEAEIEATMAGVAREGRGSLLVLPDSFSLVHRKPIISLAGQYGLPTVYWNRVFVADGGLMSYGVDLPDQLRHAAVYVDRILKGEKPGDLPVQQPTKFELVLNLNTANALGVTVASSLLAAADEVIE